MPYIIRNAKPSDAPMVADLIYSAYKDYAQQICGSLDITTILERLKVLFTHSTITIVHYSHTSVLVDNTDKVVGIVACLRGDYIPIYYVNLAEVLTQISVPGDERVADSIRDFVHTRAAYSNEYHLDILAVDKDYRGQKLADILLNHAQKRAEESELAYISLLATDDLVPFYESKGFTFRRRIVDLITYNIMLKKMDNAPLHYQDNIGHH